MGTQTWLARPGGAGAAGTRRGRLRWRTVALPPEHGSWGLTIEPTALGLLVAPSLAGCAIGLGAFAAFLLRRPLKLAWSLRARAADPRRGAALAFAALYAAVAAAAFGAGAMLAGTAPFVPLLAVAPLAALFLLQDLHNRSRSLAAELVGPVVFAAVAPAIALAAGWHPGPAGALALVLAARAVPSILYVRARIRKDRGRPAAVAAPVFAHVGSLVAVSAAVAAALLPAIALVPFAVLLLRAAIGLSPWRPPQSVRSIGFSEMGLGLFTVLCVAAGHVL